MPSYVLNSEAAFYDFLRYVNSDGFSEDVEVRFENWPVLSLNLKGKNFNATMPTGTMSFFIAVQRAINCAYALEKYNDSHKRLSNKERQDLELSIKIGQGSSDFKAELAEILNRLIAKLPQRQTKIVIIIIAGFYFTAPTVQHYFSEQAEVIIELAKENTKQHREYLKFLLKMSEMRKDERVAQHRDGLRSVGGEHPHFGEHRHIADGLHREALRAIGKSDGGEYAGVQLNGKEAMYLLRKSPAGKDVVYEAERRLDGVYQIMQVGTKDEDKYRFTIKNEERTLRAVLFNSNLSQEMKRVLQNGQWERRHIKMEIRARVIYDSETGEEVGYKDVAILSAEYE